MTIQSRADLAEEVIDALRGITRPVDVTGRVIGPGDWAVKAIGGKGRASLRIVRVWPAEKITKARELIRQRIGTVPLHVVTYEARALGQTPYPSKSTCEGAQLCLVEADAVSPKLVAVLGRDRKALDSDIAAVKADWQGFLAAYTTIQ